ncbi:hypothetical protein ACFWPV_11745 [Streptomyces uncialis]|uniref:hypothetical protein n=1 Tax=Streptomyces uncialis TaxID=1048205 RepID=UPI003650F8C2
MNADAARRPNPEPDRADRVEAFADGGLRLRRLAADGHLTRGLRAVLAHHAIFAFNRAGVSATEQAATAWLGPHVAFTEEEAPGRVRPPSPAPQTYPRSHGDHRDTRVPLHHTARPWRTAWSTAATCAPLT